MMGPVGGDSTGGLGSGFSRGTRDLDPGTGGVRDTYNPSKGAIASQSQYGDEIEKEAREGRKGGLTRILRSIRRSIWGA